MGHESINGNFPQDVESVNAEMFWEVFKAKV